MLAGDCVLRRRRAFEFRGGKKFGGMGVNPEGWTEVIERMKVTCAARYPYALAHLYACLRACA